MKRTLILLAFAGAVVGGCSLQPLYAGGQRSSAAQLMRSISVAPIPGQAGWLVRTALVDRLGEGAGERFRLEVELDDDIASFGIRGDSSATRERRTLRARYRLIEAATGMVVLDATAGSDAGVDVVGSEYATIAAEQAALERLSKIVADQIVARLGLYAVRGGSAR